MSFTVVSFFKRSFAHEDPLISPYVLKLQPPNPDDDCFYMDYNRATSQYPQAVINFLSAKMQIREKKKTTESSIPPLVVSSSKKKSLLLDCDKEDEEENQYYPAYFSLDDLKKEKKISQQLSKGLFWRLGDKTGEKQKKEKKKIIGKQKRNRKKKRPSKIKRSSNFKIKLRPRKHLKKRY